MDAFNPTTSGGGFSEYHYRPKWQNNAVERYFVQAQKDGNTPKPGFNRTGRGYPDISLAGLRYKVVLASHQNGVYGMSGTSGPCSVAAAFISNINAARWAIGKGSIGFINPTFYVDNAPFVNDITSGDNKGNCEEGFYTAAGWDPVTGLGSINYAKFQTMVVGLGTAIPTAGPTKSPSVRPTRRPTLVRPTYKPTPEPTDEPSAQPTTMPTYSTFIPSVLPTFFPTNKPVVRLLTARPTFKNPTSKPLSSAPATTMSPVDTYSAKPPTIYPTALSSLKPSTKPTSCSCPTIIPTSCPSSSPTSPPVAAPTAEPTPLPSSAIPTYRPSITPSSPPVTVRTYRPSKVPSFKPSYAPNARTAPPSSAVYSSIRVYQVQ